jgi:hypothetical protein
LDQSTSFFSPKLFSLGDECASSAALPFQQRYESLLSESKPDTASADPEIGSIWLRDGRLLASGRLHATRLGKGAFESTKKQIDLSHMLSA